MFVRLMGKLVVSVYLISLATERPGRSISLLAVALGGNGSVELLLGSKKHRAPCVDFGSMAFPSAAPSAGSTPVCSAIKQNSGDVCVSVGQSCGFWPFDLSCSGNAGSFDQFNCQCESDGK